ncbi:MAG: ABC transporter permease [Victivallales bacterium]|nr:ABC transporter permease [Victivallales bacterium]
MVDRLSSLAVLCLGLVPAVRQRQSLSCRIPRIFLDGRHLRQTARVFVPDVVSVDVRRTGQVADAVVCVLGGMTVGLFYSNLTYLEFYKQMTSTTTINDVLVGVFTSFVFGILISICGCYQGIKCGRNSTAVGQAATTAVVSSMVCMTIASAIITVLTVILKI